MESNRSKTKQPSKRELESFKSFVFDELSFNKNHQYQFLLFYLKKYLIVLCRRQSPIHQKLASETKHQKASYKTKVLLEDARLKLDAKMENHVKNLAYLMSRENRYRPFYLRTLLNLDKESLLSYIKFKKTVLENKQMQFRRIGTNDLFKLDWLVLEEMDIKSVIAYLEILRPPITDRYVMCGLTFAQKMYLSRKGPDWEDNWKEIIRLVRSYSGKLPANEGPDCQKTLLDLYNEYLKSVKRYGRRKGLAVFSDEKVLVYRGAEQKKVFLLNHFFEKLEKHFKNLNFQRNDYITYLLRHIEKEQKPNVSLDPKIGRRILEIVNTNDNIKVKDEKDNHN